MISLLILLALSGWLTCVTLLMKGYDVDAVIVAVAVWITFYGNEFMRLKEEHDNADDTEN